MAKYRKKPVVVEAVQYLREENIGESQEFCPDMVYVAGDNEYYIKTLEGNMKISKGDYIIKGIQGEFYPCKPDIFRRWSYISLVAYVSYYFLCNKSTD